MRILFAVHGYKPAWRIGGPIISVSSLAESLVERGHEVITFTSNSDQDGELEVETNRPIVVDGVQVWYFACRQPLKKLFPKWNYVSKSLGFLYCPQMAAELDRVIPTVDLVHTHLPFNYPCIAAAHAAFRHGKPLFYHQRGVFDPERLKFRSVKKLPYLWLVERPILRRATTLIALTKAEEASYRGLGVSTPCRIIPNGIDVKKYWSKQATELIQPLGIRPNHKVVLFLSRIHPIKGADRLLDAFFEVQRAEPNAVLVLAGPDEFGLEATFRQRALNASVQGRVIFPGMVHGELKQQLLRRADLFCLPSDAEGFSMAILEAMASETPVLISPGCHFPEVEMHGAGQIVAPESAALARALKQMLGDRNELKAMGLRARLLVARDYTWDRVANATLDAYAEGIARHRTQRRAVLVS